MDERRKQKATMIKRIIRNVVNESLTIPDNAIISLDVETSLIIFTKKRLELITCIKRFNPQSVQRLSDITHRKKQAVNRDLKMLERFGIIELRKQGRIKIPTVKRDILILNLQQKESQQEIFLTHTHAHEITS